MAVRIYTKTGDSGETSLFGGKRLPKDALRIEAYGTIDELNSTLGIVLSTRPPQKTSEMISVIQDELFAIGSDLAAPFGEGEKPRVERLRPEAVSRLEEAIDLLEEKLPELKSFIIPGGTGSAAMIHFARAVCRRAERAVVRLSHSEKINPAIIPYLNRLSDLLFVMARYVNHDSGQGEIIWPQK